jgi:hypothetical protein
LAFWENENRLLRESDLAKSRDRLWDAGYCAAKSNSSENYKYACLVIAAFLAVTWIYMLITGDSFWLSAGKILFSIFGRGERYD